MRFHSELSLDDIRPYLSNAKTQQGGHVTCDCPVCGKAGHLHIDERDGKLLIYCQFCNAKGTDCFPIWRQQGAKPTAAPETEQINYYKVPPKEDYRHVYTNPDGTEAYYKRRRKWADGHKMFSFAYVDANGEIHKAKPPGCNNLYNLHLLAKHEQEILYIVEGEKCADAMVKNGLLATTTNTGAQRNVKLSDVDKQLLATYPIKIVIPDNDEKGQDYAGAWPGAKILKMTDFWAECPKKGDVADYFAAGGSADKISSYQWPVALDLSREYFSTLDRYQLVDKSLLEAIAALTEPSERQRVLTIARFRAAELCCKRDFESCWKAHLQAEAAKGIRSDNLTKFPQQLFALRCGNWVTSSAGVYRDVMVGMEPKREYASPIPIMPVELLVNVDDATEKIRLSYFKDGCWRHLVVPRSIIASNNKIILLADNGVEVNSENANLLVKYLAEVIALNPDILPRSKSSDHMGWSMEDRFIPYADDIKLDCEDQFKTLVASVAEKGTLDEWADYVRPLRENLFLRLIMAASFASVLIEKVSALPFVLHLWGGTGSGKTVAAMVAASIWGNPKLGHMVRTMNMTVNSMMSTAAVLRNLPFFGDELQTIKSRFENYDTLIMRVCEGVDRGRMTNSVFQKQKVWSNAFIFTGEEPCTKQQSGGGVKNRVIEIECDTPIVTNGNQIVDYIGSHYGVAGKAFLAALDGMQLSKEYQGMLELVLELADTTEKQAMSMALMLLADCIAVKAIFKGEPMLKADEVVSFLKSKSEVDPAERAYQIIMDVFNEHTDKFIEGSHSPSDFGHVCWGSRSVATLLINKTVLERELAALGFDFAAVKKKWAAKGYLLKDSQGRYATHASVGGAKGRYVMLKN